MSDLISRDEAIRELNGACSSWEDDAKVQEIVMAIPSAKPTGDLISRADAIDCCECHGSQECKDRIKALPSAEAVSREEYDQLEALYDAIRVYDSSAEATGDLISRQWLLDLYATPEDGDDVEWKVPLEVVRQNILDAPSAEAVQGGRYENAMQKLREMPRYLNGVRAKQIKKIPPEAVQGDGKMIPIELKKRYPHSRDEDITDAFMRGYQALSAEVVQGWIPCSEKLPEANEVVILCGKYNMFCGYHNTNGEWYSITGDGWETDMDFPDSNKGDILAWMPLPKPYKGGDAE